LLESVHIGTAGMVNSKTIVEIKTAVCDTLIDRSYTFSILQCFLLAQSNQPHPSLWSLSIQRV